jgi:UDP-N-acetylglucosamine acyltransferase
MKVHPSAVIHPQAQVASSAAIGPHSVIGAGVEIGDDCEIMPHVVIEGPTKIGKRNRIFSYAAVGFACQDLKYKGEATRLEIGDDNIIREFTTLNRGTVQGGGVTRIGSHNFLMAYVHIAHDCQLGNHIIMANGASLAGHVEVADYASIGAFCLIHQNCRVGAYAFLGSASLINKDILPYAKTSAERSAAVYGANRVGLERRGFTRDDIDELDKAFRLLSRSKLNTTQALEAIEAKGFESPHVRALVEFVKTSERGVVK